MPAYLELRKTPVVVEDSVTLFEKLGKKDELAIVSSLIRAPATKLDYTLSSSCEAGKIMAR